MDHVAVRNFATFTSSAGRRPYVAPSQTHLWRGNSMTVTGPNVDTVIDQTGTANLAFHGTQPTVTTHGIRTFWKGGVLSVDVATPEVMASGTIMCVLQINTQTTQVYVAAGNAGSLTTNGPIIWSSGPTTLSSSAPLTARDLPDATSSPPGIVPLLLTWDPLGAAFYLSGVQIAVTAAAASVANVGRWVVGATAGFAIDDVTSDFGEVRTTSAKSSAADIAAYSAYVAGYFV